MWIFCISVSKHTGGSTLYRPDWYWICQLTSNQHYMVLRQVWLQLGSNSLFQLNGSANKAITHLVQPPTPTPGRTRFFNYVYKWPSCHRYKKDGDLYSLRLEELQNLWKTLSLNASGGFLGTGFSQMKAPSKNSWWTRSHQSKNRTRSRTQVHPRLQTNLPVHHPNRSRTPEI